MVAVVKRVNQRSPDGRTANGRGLTKVAGAHERSDPPGMARDLPGAPQSAATPFGGPERRRSPRRRLRDRIASLESAAGPSLRGRRELANLVLLVEDDLRQAALGLSSIEEFLARSLALLEGEPLDAAALASHAGDDEVAGQLDALSENLANLRRRMGMIAASLK